MIIDAQVNPAPNATIRTVDHVVNETLLSRFVEGDGNRRRRRVAIAVHVYVDLFHRDVRVLGRRLDDPDVGLVRNEQIDVCTGEPRGIESTVGRLGHRPYGVLEHFAPGHAD